MYGKRVYVITHTNCNWRGGKDGEALLEVFYIVTHYLLADIVEECLVYVYLRICKYNDN